MALDYPWKPLRPDPLRALEVKMPCGETRVETYWPVKLDTNTLIKADAEGDAVFGVCPNGATLADTADVVIIDKNLVCQCQLTTGEDPSPGDYVMISDQADGSVAVLAAPAADGTNYACGIVVDYDPASGGLCHIALIGWSLEASLTTTGA